MSAAECLRFLRVAVMFLFQYWIGVDRFLMTDGKTQRSPTSVERMPGLTGKSVEVMTPRKRI